MHYVKYKSESLFESELHLCQGLLLDLQLMFYYQEETEPLAAALMTRPMNWYTRDNQTSAITAPARKNNLTVKRFIDMHKELG